MKLQKDLAKNGSMAAVNLAWLAALAILVVMLIMVVYRVS